jgi:hypothetical protein
MKLLILAILAVVWGAALIPPLLRSRSELRPNSSVNSFRRTLADMSRIPARPGQGRRADGSYAARPAAPVRALRPTPNGPSRSSAASRYGQYGPSSHADVARPLPTSGYSPGLARARANRAAMVRRRQNVLFTLVLVVVISAIGAITLGWPLFKLSLLVGLLLLAVYVWRLLAIRRDEQMRARHPYASYSDAA